jgi:DNA-binding CsgD family transcriptional regulator/PAS domain-containing protein
MDEQQLLTQRTMNGWLSLVAGMELGDDDAAVEEFANHCPLPVVVLDLTTGSVTALSPGASTLLGFDPVDVEKLDVGILTENAHLVGSLFDLLIDGTIDAYEARRQVRKADKGSVDTESWVVVTGAQHRQRALWVMVPRSQRPGERLPLPKLESWPGAVPGLVMGVIDPSWDIERLSPRISELLGIPADELRGTALPDLIHPDDLTRAFAAVARAFCDEAPVGLQLRLREGTNAWRTVSAVFAPLDETEFHVGFAFHASSPQSSADDTEAARVAVLEGHLRRIAQEIEASGIASGFDAISNPEVISGLGDLSPRQWEILRRLLRGERVPGISQALFLSQSAVRNHVSALLRKLGVKSQAELIALVRAQAVDLTQRPS